MIFHRFDCHFPQPASLRNRQKKVKLVDVAERMLNVLEKEDRKTEPLNRDVAFIHGLLPTFDTFTEDEVLRLQDSR